MSEKQIAFPGGVMTEYTPTKPKEALPCPWCGTKPQMQPWHGGGPNKKMLGCVSDRCEISPCVTGESPEEAIRKWNRRKRGISNYLQELAKKGGVVLRFIGDGKWEVLLQDRPRGVTLHGVEGASLNLILAQASKAVKEPA